MYKVQLLNKIAKIGTKEFDPSLYEVGENVTSPELIMVRSANMLESEFSNELIAIGRAGAGVNNIPVDKCAKQGIVVFNTPGANANGVTELTIASLLLASRDIIGGVEWAKTLTQDAAKAVEKGKSKFAGNEIKGKTLGVIGLGAIGGMVANIAVHLGMRVIGYDPYVTVDAAWRLSSHVTKAQSYDEIFEKCDYITVHVPATKDTKGMFCKAAFDKMKDGVKIINLSRADLVNSADMIEAVKSGKVSKYVTDFPTDEIIGVDGIVAIPHLGASTEESEDNCAVMAARELIDYCENGNIVNSVNYPGVSSPRNGMNRLCIMHFNIPAVISSVTSAFAADNINIENLVNGSKGEYAYTIVDIKSEIRTHIVDEVKKINGVIRVRSL